MTQFETGYYWAYRKGSPIPDIVFVWEGKAHEFVVDTECGSDMPVLAIDSEDLSEQKWILGERIVPPGVDNLP